MVSHPLGPLTADRFLRIRVFDIALHAWDLATAIGREIALDDGLTAHILQTMETEESGMGFGITPSGRVGLESSPQERLLDLAGRFIDPDLG